MSADGAVDLRRSQPLDGDEVLALVQSRFGFSVADPVTLGGEFDRIFESPTALGAITW